MIGLNPGSCFFAQQVVLPTESSPQPRSFFQLSSPGLSSSVPSVVLFSFVLWQDLPLQLPQLLKCRTHQCESLCADFPILLVFLRSVFFIFWFCTNPDWFQESLMHFLARLFSDNWILSIDQPSMGQAEGKSLILLECQWTLHEHSLLGFPF